MRLYEYVPYTSQCRQPSSIVGYLQSLKYAQWQAKKKARVSVTSNLRQGYRVNQQTDILGNSIALSTKMICSSITFMSQGVFEANKPLKYIELKNYENVRQSDLSLMAVKLLVISVFAHHSTAT